MHSHNFTGFLFNSFWLIIITLISFTALHWLNLPGGQLIDWLIGFASCWWLLAIVTIPWNIHFEAKETVADIEESKKLNITVEEEQMSYAKLIQNRSFHLAITLHIVSALALFGLSYFSITPVGYVGSVFALLLTALRPSLRAYDYLWTRLTSIRHHVKYPRNDVVELKNNFTNLKKRVEEIEFNLDPGRANSLTYRTNESLYAIDTKIETINQDIRDLRVSNIEDHQKLERESKNAIARLSADSQFLDHVSEIVRFIKSA